jgi:hypothetical protein
MENLNLPIIIAEGLDVNFYTSEQKAILALEVEDIVDEVYKAFDSKGHKIRLYVHDGKICLNRDVKVDTHDELKVLMSEFLRAIKVDTKNSDLASMLKLCEKYFI